MTYKFVAFLAVLLMLLSTTSSAFAQADTCSLSSLLTSFEAAALSNSVEAWQQQYTASKCPSNVTRAVRLFAQGYYVFEAENVDVLLARNWGNGSGVRHSDNQRYTNVSVEFTTVASGNLEGYFSLISPYGPHRLALIGNYYGFSEVDANVSPFDSVKTCQDEEIIVWVRWNLTSILDGVRNYNLDRLYVASVTSEGHMCIATLETPQGGSVVTTWTVEALFDE